MSSVCFLGLGFRVQGLEFRVYPMPKTLKLQKPGTMVFGNGLDPFASCLEGSVHGAAGK